MCRQPIYRALVVFAVLSSGCGPTPRESPSGSTGPTDDDHDGYSLEDGDCNDHDPTIHEGVNEICDDGVDNDCNGYVDHEDYPCFTACELAAYQRSSVGCVYYAVDTNSIGRPFAVAVSNIDPTTTANVVIEKKTGGTWAPVTGGTFAVAPRMLQTLEMDRRFAVGTAIYAGGSYRITSDVPVIAYQFAPLDGALSYLSDASLLLPVSALDKHYIVSAWPYGVEINGTPEAAHIQIAASEATTVTVTAPIETLAGSLVPGLVPSVPSTFSLAEGDYLQLTVRNLGDSFSGTYVESDKPVAVFSSNDCAMVPNIQTSCCCDHLEEQLFGLQTWGKSYVAAQMPRRFAESSFWQILAQQDDTTVTFTPAAGVTGLPPSVVLAARQMVEYEVIGGATPGDFLATSDKPILVNQYTVGAYHAQWGSDVGDADMVQAIPTAQFLAHYTVLVPGTWVNDFLVLTRKQGSTVTVDGSAPIASWNPVADGWETAVVPVPDGVHTLDGDMPFGVAVSGYDQYDSYSYPGGLGQAVINPI